MIKQKYFSKFEICLWAFSVTLTLISFFVFDRSNYISLFASLFGVTALIFNAKGNPLGPLLLIVFSILYGIISYGYAYYGEMITYVGMSMPMAIVSLVTWLKNPYKGKKSQVTINNNIGKKEIITVFAVSLLVTLAFYYILKIFGTANLIPSTVSVTTSFMAAYFSFRRSPYFALVYAINDIILIILWTLAAMDNINYISVIVCFVVFLFNDLYSFFNWKRIEKKQKD